ncbi:hypothetical protein [Paracoccus sp. SSJ]|uniref:hypothetical protein n=1 Tax=Paracoccus sp. SSJ TaxID=3050636 RepID=UPI00254E106F|nr:hypothetical protein [Paracoccus sp. SSJ]MDK8874416.1 hypothetical protein [Paracoccus sp. SSJ]
MPRTGGIYTLPSGYFATSGEIIQPSQHNPPLEDIAQALTDSLPRNGTAPMTGNLPMGGNRITGIAAAVSGSHVPRYDQVMPLSGGTVTGTITIQNYTALRMSNNAGDERALLYTSAADENFVYLRVTDPLGGQGFYRFMTGGADLTSPNDVVRRESGDARYMQQSWSITAGDGLTGGGNGSANRTVAVNNTVVRTSRVISAGDGLQGGGTLSADRTISVDNTVVRNTRSVSGGAGLTGGGDLSANRTIAMGTPSSITRTSTNTASGDTHTHSLPQAAFRDMMANYIQPGQVGSVVFAVNNGSLIGMGATTSGSNLRPSDHSGLSSPDALSGTWQCCGYCPNGAATNWLRIS